MPPRLQDLIGRRIRCDHADAPDGLGTVVGTGAITHDDNGAPRYQGSPFFVALVRFDADEDTTQAISPDFLTVEA